MTANVSTNFHQFGATLYYFNMAKSNYMRISNLLNRVFPVCSNWDLGKADWPGYHVIKMLKKQTIYIRSGLAWLTGPTRPLRTNRVTKSMCCYAAPIIENQQIGVLRTCISNFIWWHKLSMLNSERIHWNHLKWFSNFGNSTKRTEYRRDRCSGLIYLTYMYSTYFWYDLFWWSFN